KIAAAELIQKDIESQRDAKLKAHEIAIKANAEVLRSWQDHMHDRIMAGVDAKHDAFLERLKASLVPEPVDAAPGSTVAPAATKKKRTGKAKLPSGGEMSFEMTEE